MYGMRMMGMSVGIDNFSGQLTLSLLLAGGAAAFMSYWRRSDNYYIVLYGTVGIWSGMLTMLFDYGINLDSRKQQLMTCLQDYGKCHAAGEWPEGTGDQAAVAEEERRAHPGPLPGQRTQGAGRRGLEQTAASRERSKKPSRMRTRKILVRTGCRSKSGSKTGPGRTAQGVYFIAPGRREELGGHFLPEHIAFETPFMV